MSKRMWIAIASVLVGMGLAAPAFAQRTPGAAQIEPAKPAAPADKPGGPAEATPPAGKADAEKEATGKVVSINAAGKTLVVEADGKRMSFSVAEPAAKRLAQFKRGDQVTVRYSEDGGKLMAQHITKG